MRLLLDTHVVIWELGGSRTVGPRAEETLRQASELLISVLAFAEIGIKVSTGKLEAPDDLQDVFGASGVSLLGLTPDHCYGVARLPMHHRDPFDRLLVSQALTEGLTIVTADKRIARYDVPVVAADA